MKIEFDNAPLPGVPIPVCDGIDWAYLPLPFALDHVNCWLLNGADQQILIDTGVDNAPTRALWETIFSQHQSWPSQLLITHFHPDHMGLAGWFQMQGCSRFLGSEQETALALKLWFTSDNDYSAGYEHWYRSHGLPDDVVQTVRDNGNTYSSRVHRPPEEAFWRFLQDGQSLSLAGRNYTVMKGQGHAPDMIMLYRGDDHVLIAADQVLPFISPNVSYMPRLPDRNPLELFLNTLLRLQELPEDTLVLPSHGLPFRGLHGRLDALLKHHQLRLQQVLSACKEPRTAHELFTVLFRRSLDAQQTSFALGESLAHLHYLENQGKLRRLQGAGVARFQGI